MFDHRKMLGYLFIAWAIIQAVLAVVMLAIDGMPTQNLMLGLAYWVLTALLVAVYFFVGIRLRAHDPRLRIPAMVLCVLALLSFPFGTLLGIYGLWVMLRKPREAAAG